MPAWGEILKEYNELSTALQHPAFDELRRKYLTLYANHTQRDVILYASGWLQKTSKDPGLMAINDEDIQGFMEVMHGLNNPNVDLILHSPGGSGESAEAIVNYLRSKFTNIRVVVPQQAMSAACMLACGADTIVMGKHSFLGPIDPQFVMRTPNMGVQSIPAQAILDQFELAKTECMVPGKVNAWVPMLGQYGPALLIQCVNALKLSENLVASWLAKYMMAGDDGATEKARDIAKALAKHNDHMSHGRHLPRDVVEGYGMKIVRLEDDQQLQDLALSIFHATTLALSVTAAVKIIENHNGRAFIKQEITQMIVPPQMMPPPPAPEPQ